MKTEANNISLTPAMVVGLLISFFGYGIIQTLLAQPGTQNGLSQDGLTILGLAGVWILAGFLLLLVVRWEIAPLSSIGFRTLRLGEALLAAGMGVVLSISVPVMTLLVARVVPATDEGSVAALSGSTSWFVLLIGVITTGIVEEIIFRGYLIERLEALIGNRWLAAGISLIAFILAHVLTWNMQHLVAVVIPLGAIMTGIYLWKRNLPFNMIVHIVVNLPLVFLALANAPAGA